MSSVLAAEGGYQAFHLAGAEWAILVFAAACALVAIGVGFLLMNDVLKKDQGTPKMQEIALAIQEGAWAYLKRQFKTIALILLPLIVVVFLRRWRGGRTVGGASYGLSGQPDAGVPRWLRHVGLAGYRRPGDAGNVRTAAAARRSMRRAAVAFRTGGVAGMFTVGLGLLGATSSS